MKQLVGQIYFYNVYKNINFIVNNVECVLAQNNYSNVELTNYFLSLGIFSLSAAGKLVSNAIINTLRFRTIEDKSLFLNLSGFVEFLINSSSIVQFENNIATFAVNPNLSAVVLVKCYDLNDDYLSELVINTGPFQNSLINEVGNNTFSVKFFNLYTKFEMKSIYSVLLI